MMGVESVNRSMQFLIGISMVLVVMTFMCVSLVSAVGEEGASLSTVLLCVGVPIILVLLVIFFFGTMIRNIFSRFGGGVFSTVERDWEDGSGIGDWISRILGR